MIGSDLFMCPTNHNSPLNTSATFAKISVKKVQLAACFWTNHTLILLQIIKTGD